MCPTRPWFQSSHTIYTPLLTDDTTEFICERVMDSAYRKKAAWTIVASSACRHAEKGVRAGFSLDNTDIGNGLLVKLTFPFSACSTMAPPVIRVAGLCEIPRLQHVIREAIQNDCLRFRKSVRSCNIAGSQRFTKSWFWDSSWVLWVINVDYTTTNEHSTSESSDAWMVKLAYLL